MAMWMLNSSQTLSTSTNQWNRVEAYNFPTTANIATYDDLKTERTYAVTFANAGNQTGIILGIRNFVTTAPTTPTGTLTVKLYEGANLRTTDTFTCSDYFPSGYQSFVYLPLTSYAVTTAGSTWSYKISHDTTSILGWMRSNTAGDYYYAAVLSTAGTPTTNDLWALKQGVTLTIDQSATLSRTVASTLGKSIILCDNATLSNPAPASAITLTMPGSIVVGGRYAIDIGTTTAASTANKFTIDMSGSTTQTPIIDPYNSATTNTAGLVCPIRMYGYEEPYLKADVASLANALQKVIVTSQDMSAIWQNGDTVIPFGKATTSADYTTYTIASMSGTSITLNANLDYKVYAGGILLNVTRADNLGIKIVGCTSGTNGLLQPPAAYDYFDFRGVYFLRTMVDRTDINSITKIGTTSSVDTLKNCVMHATASSSYFPLYLVTTNSSHSISITNTYIQGGIHGVVNLNGFNNSTISGLYIKNGGISGIAQLTMTGNNNTLTGIGTYQTTGARANDGIIITGNANTLTTVHASSARYGLTITGSYNTVNTPNLQNCLYNVHLNSGVNNTINTGSIGTVDTSTSGYEFYTATSTLNQILCNSTSLGTYAFANITNLIDNSYIRFATYGGTANDHRCVEKYGYMVSTGDSLTDTTVRTSGTGKFALRFEPTSSTNNLTWDFTVPTGDIQTKTMTVFAWAKINSATYYAGTHQKPRLSINYDNGTTAYAEATGSTDWQLLHVTFTPTTTYGQITVTVSGKTDATTTNAYFYIDDFGIAYPPNVALDLGGLDNWANGLPVTPPIALPLSAGTVAQQVALNVPGQIKYIAKGRPLY